MISQGTLKPTNERPFLFILSLFWFKLLKQGKIKVRERNSGG